MAVRGVSIILAAVFYQTLWLALIFAVLGTVLPWIAVMMANDRPPKKKLDVNRYSPPRPDRILENPARPGRIIEHWRRAPSRAPPRAERGVGRTGPFPGGEAWVLPP